MCGKETKKGCPPACGTDDKTHETTNLKINVFFREFLKPVPCNSHFERAPAGSADYPRNHCHP
jgi:hypothetical protein